MDNASRSNEDQHAGASPYAPSLRVLVVEPKPEVADAIDRACRSTDFRVAVTVARDAAEALQRLRDLPSPPDIALVSARVLPAFSTDPAVGPLAVIALADSDAERESIRLRELPCHACLVRPDEPTALRRSLNSAFRLWFLMPRLSGFGRPTKR